MICCDNLLHPFQNDPGVSQRQRIVDELLSDSIKIDGRQLADLLQYISQLSRHITYYDDKLAIGDWRPFFSKSIPFLLARIIKFDKGPAEKKFKTYKNLFRRKPTRQSLQLITHFIYYQTIHLINRWHKETAGTELTVEKIVEKIIRDKLKDQVSKFICLANTAVQTYKIRKIDFNKLQDNSVWEFTADEIRQSNCFVSNASSRKKRLISLGNEIAGLFPGLLNTISLSVPAAELSLDQSLFPSKEEFKEKHSPHLALLFAFLKLFTYFQNDLNSYTKKHLDFFYKDVLRLKPRAAVADKAHILFEIQNQLEKYLLKRSTLVKNGKDINKVDINFALDDEIVINKTKIAELKTLFLNNKEIYNTSFAEGVYIAPDATKADGLEKDFKDDDPKNWPTLGNKYSKYIDPEQKFVKPYPDARIGFILASPVLLLNEGTRTVTITLDCELHDDYCSKLQTDTPAKKKNCCEDDLHHADTQPAGERPEKDKGCEEIGLDRLKACELYKKVFDKLNNKYYYISKELIGKAVKKGVGNAIINKLREFLRIIDPTTNKDPRLCYCGNENFKYDVTIPSAIFEDASKGGFTPDQLKILSAIFKPERVFKLYFSGEDKWIEPEEILDLSLQLVSPKTTFHPAQQVCDPNKNVYPLTITIKAILTPDQPGVTFYNKDNLKEDFETTLPLVRIELNDHIKVSYQDSVIKKFAHFKILKQTGCCLSTPVSANDHAISLYHFFRNVKLKPGAASNTKIDVSVCGLKKFIAQFENTLMDVNGPIMPWGPSPDIPDHSVVNPIVGSPPNLIGPNFFIGSNEVFRKKWNDILININWKGKPADFKEYYKAYYVNPLDSTDYGLKESEFQINLAVLEEGQWRKENAHPPPPPNAVNTILNNTYNNRPLFRNDSGSAFCGATDPSLQKIYLKRDFFTLTQEYHLDKAKDEKLDTGTQDGFLRINLQNQDFLHKDYSFVLARQMVAFGKLPDEHVEGAVYYDSTNPAGGPIVLSTTAMLDLIKTSGWIVRDVKDDVGSVNARAFNVVNPVTDPISLGDSLSIRATLALPVIPVPPADPADPAQVNNGDINLVAGANHIDTLFNDPNTGIIKKLDGLKKFAAIIPNEPWTPVISTIFLDYTATAPITDIDLIHLYPYAGTYKHEEIEETPALFPTFCDEGTLFIGLEKLVPGSNLNILFQLAEATADSESERQELAWYYLDNNEWKLLRKGFEVLNDATEDLTTSGIVKLAMPANMTKGNTILSKDYHWIRVSIPRNSRAIAETTGIHTQAALTIFTNEEENDKLRLNEALAAGSISKLTNADPQIKTTIQPYDSFGGREPEAEKNFYVRVSELLRHKGRAIQKWDYERLVLENFPQIYRTKCINHSYALDAKKFKIDFPVAPGYVILAVIPDLTKLKAGKSFEPKAPVSLLEDIEEKLRKKTSPFVRLRAMNPRYEKIDLCLKVKLYKGKDEVYYKQKLIDDIREFLAPWAIGEYSKLSFGQCINRSDMLRFIEALDYIDYIVELQMRHERDPVMSTIVQEICPHTPRSILLAGEIDVCIRQDDCDEWGSCYKIKDEQRVKVPCCDNAAKAVHDFCKPEVIIT